MQALLCDGPLEGRTIGVDTNEHDLPPAKIEVDVEDGSVHAYGFDDVDHERNVAVYTRELAALTRARCGRPAAGRASRRA